MKQTDRRYSTAYHYLIMGKLFELFKITQFKEGAVYKTKNIGLVVADFNYPPLKDHTGTLASLMNLDRVK